jgi:hypothetical protein
MHSKRCFVCREILLALVLLVAADGHSQEVSHIDLSGKWKLSAQNEKGEIDVITLDLLESGSLVTGTITPLNKKPLTIHNGYCVGTDIKLVASGRQGLLSASMEVSGHIEGNLIVVNVRRGNGSTYPAALERIAPLSKR